MTIFRMRFLLYMSLATGVKPINLLKPTGHVMTNSLTFNNCTFCPHCIYVFCIYLRTNSDFCHLQHKLIGFYNRNEKCLLRGTNWVFKYSSLRFVFKGLNCNYDSLVLHL